MKKIEIKIPYLPIFPTVSEMYDIGKVEKINLEELIKKGNKNDNERTKKILKRK